MQGKIERFDVPASTWRAGDGFTLRRVITGKGEKATTQWFKWVSKTVYPEGSLEDVIQTFQDAGKGLVDAAVSLDYEYEYGGSERYANLTVEGWATGVTQAEIDKALGYVREKQAKDDLVARRRDEADLARILATRPDLVARLTTPEDEY